MATYNIVNSDGSPIQSPVRIGAHEIDTTGYDTREAAEVAAQQLADLDGRETRVVEA